MIPSDSPKLPGLFPVPPPIGGNRESRRRYDTHKFTANTCPKCSAVTIAGAPHGIRIDLEPTTLDDHTEYAALIDDVPTYDLHPDRVARRRHLEEIKRPERVPRHARHTCGTTYGTNPRPTPIDNPRPAADGAPPF